MPYKKNMTDEDWQILAREMEARLFANIPESNDEIEHPHVFLSGSTRKWKMFLLYLTKKRIKKKIRKYE